LTLAVGIDIGATKTAAVLVDVTDGRVVRRAQVPTPRLATEVVIACRSLVAEMADGDCPVGIAVCELVDLDGCIVGSATIDFDGIDLPSAVGGEALESDVRAAAIAEARFGGASSSRAALVIAAGTGMSACLLIDGVPYRGTHGHALLLGAPLVQIEASGDAIARDARAAGLDPLAPSAAMDAIRSSAGARLGVAIAWLINALDPDTVLLGGGLAAVPAFATAAIDSARRSMEPIPGVERRIAVSSLGPDAAAIGAALVAADRVAARRP
jgi:glucokinase